LKPIKINEAKLQKSFSEVLVKLMKQNENFEELNEVKLIIESLRDSSLLEKWIILAIVASKLFKERIREFNREENLESIGFILFQILVRSLPPPDILFVISRISERSIRLFPELASLLDREINKLSKEKIQPGYIS